MGVVAARREYRFWTAEEDDLLRRCWPDPAVDTRELARRLGRTKGALQFRSDLLNIHRPFRGQRLGRVWTAEEDARLLEMCNASHSDARIARELGRRRDSVRRRRKSLTLWRDCRKEGDPVRPGLPWTEKEDARLLNLMNQGWNSVRIGRDLGRSPAAVNLRKARMRHGCRPCRPDRLAVVLPAPSRSLCAVCGDGWNGLGMACGDCKRRGY